MDRRKFLEILVGGLVGGGLVFGEQSQSEGYVNGLLRYVRERMGEDDKLFCNLIEEFHIKDIVRRNIDANPNSEYFSNIRRNLFERFRRNEQWKKKEQGFSSGLSEQDREILNHNAYEEMVNGVAFTQKMCLLSSVVPHEPSEEQYDELGRSIISWQFNLARYAEQADVVNPFTESVKNPTVELGKLKRGEFSKLHDTFEKYPPRGDLNNVGFCGEYVKALYRGTFTGPEYVENYLNKEILLNNRIGNALVSTTGPLLRVKVEREVEKMNDVVGKVLLDKTKEYYPELR